MGLEVSVINVTIYNEFVHEQTKDEVKAIYPDGMHVVIAEALKEHLGDEVFVLYATLDEPEHGLSESVLNETDVLFWWGHAAHDQVQDAIVDRVQRRVLDGMGLVVLHSGHESKIFKRLMGTQCLLRWREAGEKERLWLVSPGHPILRGIEGDFIELPQAEMYGEHFDIPHPEELLLISWFEGGEVFRSGCTFKRGQGKIFYFRPGHETYPIYFNPEIRLILANAAKWAHTPSGTYQYDARHVPKPLSKIDSTDA